MDPSQLFTQLGVGGAIAGLLFYFYRKDVKLYTEQWRGQSEALLQVVKENTNAITSNTEVTRAMHRRLDVITAEEFESGRTHARVVPGG